MSLYEQLQEKLNGQPYNNYFSALCPFHDDHTPSFFVYEDGRFYCKSCRKSGTHEYLNKFLGGHSVKSSPKKSVVLPQWKMWENKYGDLEGIAAFAHKHAEHWYFKQRQIDEFFELGYFGSLDNWVLFPVLDINRKVLNIVVRHTKRKDVRYAIKRIEEAKPLLYSPSWKRVQENDTVYVPFGIVDSWAFEACNLASLTSIVGKSLSVELLRPLNKNIVFVPDDGEEREAHILANKLGWKARVKRLLFPDGTKDCDDIRRKFGNQYFAEMLGVSL